MQQLKKNKISYKFVVKQSFKIFSDEQVPIKRQTHFRDPPARQTAEYSRPNGQPGFKAGNELVPPESRSRPFHRDKNDLRRQKPPNPPSENAQNRRLSVRRVLVFYTSGPPAVPRRGYARGGASVASLRTPQTSTRLFPAKSIDCPVPPSLNPLPASKAAAREPR